MATAPAVQDVAPRRVRVPAAIRGILAATAAIAIAVVIAASGTGVSWAFWNGSTTTTNSSIGTGTVGLLVQGQPTWTVTGLGTSALLPNRTVVRAEPVVLSNTGSVPLSVAWTGTTYSSANAAMRTSLVGSLRAAPATGGCAASASTSALATTMPAVTIPAGGTARVCVEIGMTAGAPSSVQGAAAGVGFALTGTQVRP
jgi:hypothetical protein